MRDPEFPGRIKVRTLLDPRFGEVYFEIEASKRSTVTNKCLYDGLSDFGIELERAKHIVKDVAILINSGKFYHIEETDYVKYGRERRQEIEGGDPTGFSPVEL
jgi:hypothetical protein